MAARIKLILCASDMLERSQRRSHMSKLLAAEQNIPKVSPPKSDTFNVLLSNLSAIQVGYICNRVLLVLTTVYELYAYVLFVYFVNTENINVYV